VTSSDVTTLLPGGMDVPFQDIEATLTRFAGEQGERQRAAGALTATVVVVGPRDRLVAAADALMHLAEPGGVRAIVIASGSNAAPAVRVAPRAVALDGLRPEYLNNAVASLRLSSLPTLVWWRGGMPDSLDGLSQLADRVMLDVEDPGAVWARALTLLERAAFSDLRWTRLTRWRALMAHFFDLAAVRDAAPLFNRLRIAGSDVYCARLFAGWLQSALRWKAGAHIQFDIRPGAAPLESIELGDGRQQLTLRLVPGGTCVETSVRVDGHASASRIVSLGDQSLEALISEELRIRSRDVAFEQALQSAGAIK
jgi:glucose-6-phosphate dehydrogenase-like protein OpcA